MDYLIPLSYHLYIHDVINDENLNNCYYYDNDICMINNFSLYTNKNYLIYRITSGISLEFLLDFLYNYDNLVIKKIYYFLIIKHLMNLSSIIKKESFFTYLKEKKYHDLILNTREYHISNNNEIIITDYINFNICLIIMNKSINKTMVAIIDRNCLLDSLVDIISDSNIYIYNQFEDIEITIICASSIQKIDIIIHIYNYLKQLKLSKFIKKTNLTNKNKIKRLKIDTTKGTIKKIRYDYYDKTINYYKNNTYYSSLHRK